MEVGAHFSRNPLLHSPSHFCNSPPLQQFCFLPAVPARRRRLCRSKGNIYSFRATAFGNEDGSGDFWWDRVARSVKVGSERFWSKFTESLKKETGFDSDAGKLVGGVVEAVNEGRKAVDWFRLEMLPAFVDWNRWENWKVPFFLWGYIIFLPFFSSFDVVVYVRMLRVAMRFVA